MAGILSRFGEIMSSSANAMLDKLEDPAKMVDQYLRDAKDELAEVRSETAAVMAQEKQTKRTRDEIEKKIQEYQTAMTNAAAQGASDDELRQLISKKNDLVARLTDAETAYQAAKTQSDQLKQMHNKLVQDIQDLEGRKANVKAMAATAKAQEKINKLGAKGRKDVAGKFTAMEDKARMALDKAQAEAELTAEPVDEAESVLAKYAGPAGGQSVDDELAALRAAAAGGKD